MYGSNTIADQIATLESKLERAHLNERTHKRTEWWHLDMASKASDRANAWQRNAENIAWRIRKLKEFGIG